MNENLKTAIYVGVAAAFGLLAWMTLPSTDQAGTGTAEGQPLFAGFTDTTKAASLEIIWHDNTANETKSFKVSSVGGQWVIPSHHNYPADAQRQIQDAAQALFGLESLGKHTEVPEEHELCGVVEPPPPGPGATLKKGLGKLVILKDSKGDDLVRMVIGDAVEGSPEQRFVRTGTSQNLGDTVYVVRLDVEKLPTDFGKWIERDLLRLNPNDVAKLTLKDYSIVKALNQAGRSVYVPQLRMQSTVSWNTLDNNWDLDRFQLFDEKGQPFDADLGDGEELSKTKLDDLKNALDDLKIEGVDRKPEGLGANLAVEEEVESNKELEESLREHGYIVGSLGGNKSELFSSNGEVVVDCSDGVRYTLRFGDVAGVQEGSSDKLNRYLLVSAQVAEDILQPPVLEPEPAGPSTEPAAAEPAKTEPSGEKEKTGQPQGACQDETKTDEAQAEKAKTEKGKGKAAAQDEKGKAPAAGAPPTAPPPPTTPPRADDPKTKLEEIKKKNKRALDTYNENLNKAKGRVAELNARFANWYYIISEDTYKKIHLSRSDVIQEGAGAKESGYGVDAFRKLESDGLKKSSSPGGAQPLPPRAPLGGGPGLP